MCAVLSHFICVRLFAFLWPVARQAPLVGGILQARILEWVSHSLLQRIFPTQGLNPGLLDCRQILYCLSYQWVAGPHIAQVSVKINEWHEENG